MINLEKLQEEIDQLLESETSDSLTNWIFESRFTDLNQIIGSGQFVSLTHSDTHNIEFIQALEPNNNIEVESSVCLKSTSFRNAA